MRAAVDDPPPTVRVMDSGRGLAEMCTAAIFMSFHPPSIVAMYHSTECAQLYLTMHTFASACVAAVFTVPPAVLILALSSLYGYPL